MTFVSSKNEVTPASEAWLVSRDISSHCLFLDWPPSYVHYHPSSITSINIFLYELPLFLGSEHSQTQPSEDCVHVFSDKNKSLTTGASLLISCTVNSVQIEQI